MGLGVVWIKPLDGNSTRIQNNMENINFYVHDLGYDNMIRVIYFNVDGDNYWYDIKNPFYREHYFWFPESLGYAKLYFIGEGYYVPSWVKQGCGW